MQKANNMPAIKAAHDAMRDACEAYSEAVITAIPAGSTVALEHGNKWLGPYIVQSVSTAWWSTPGRLYLYNPRTGKYRDAAPCQLRLLEPTTPESGGERDE